MSIRKSGQALSSQTQLCGHCVACVRNFLACGSLFQTRVQALGNWFTACANTLNSAMTHCFCTLGNCYRKFFYPFWVWAFNRRHHHCVFITIPPSSLYCNVILSKSYAKCHVRCLYGRLNCDSVWSDCLVAGFIVGIWYSSTESTMCSEIQVGVIHFILMWTFSLLSFVLRLHFAINVLTVNPCAVSLCT